ncbi:MAG: hypothetical protein ACI4PH_08385 [Faecousia sp.]
MTIYKARKISIAFYMVAAALLFLYLLLSPEGTLRYLLFAGVAVFFVLGFQVANKFCRCPKCGRVQQVGLYKITQCPYCSQPIDENTACPN